LRHSIPSSALPPEKNNHGASPKAISGRTSYYQARLAFHFLPQLIPEYCTAHGFGPPPDFRRDSPWPWQARLASGLEYIAKNALLALAFAAPPGQNPLDELYTRTRWFVLQKARRHRAHNKLCASAPTLCRQNGFRFYFTGITSLLFTFPSRYWFTIGEIKYLALAG
jgi:hypothetical protein